MKWWSRQYIYFLAIWLDTWWMTASQLYLIIKPRRQMVVHVLRLIYDICSEWNASAGVCVSVRTEVIGMNTVSLKHLYINISLYSEMQINSQLTRSIFISLAVNDNVSEGSEFDFMKVMRLTNNWFTKRRLVNHILGISNIPWDNISRYKKIMLCILELWQYFYNMASV